MISKEKILGLIEGLLAEKKFFLVSLDIGPSNNIRLVVDSTMGIQISECVQLSRAIEQGLNRDSEDFDIEVSSPGLGTPFKIREQYDKNIGKAVEVISKEGQKIKGILILVDDNSFSIEQEKKIKIEGKKKKQIIKEKINFAYNNVSKVRNVLKY